MLKIADVAAAAGVAAGTLRLWEHHGLLVPERTESGQRLYSPTLVDRARRISEMRSKERLSLREIGEMLNGFAGERAEPLPSGAGGRGLSPGQQIRQLRSQRNLSITDVATALEVSPSLISTFERTSNGVSVALLKRIGDFFDVTVTSLAFSPSPDLNDSGDAERRPPARLSAGIDVRGLATGRKMMDVKEWTLQPGANSEGAYNHDGEEFVYVLAGRFEISVEGRGTMILEKGDSLYFESNRRHSWINSGEEPCSILWVNTGSF